MKTLLVLRHAKSSWGDASMSDHDRPLKDRGRRDAPRMGRLLAAEGQVPDLILCSTARRARETAAAVAQACGYGGEVQLEQRLYGARPEDVLDVVREYGAEHGRLMVVGHNPTMETLVALLTGDHQSMSTAALAQIELSIERWTSLAFGVDATLRGFWRPKMLTED